MSLPNESYPDTCEFKGNELSPWKWSPPLAASRSRSRVRLEAPQCVPGSSAGRTHCETLTHAGNGRRVTLYEMYLRVRRTGRGAP